MSAIQTEVDEEWSIGDYVLSGGELPAMTLIDAVSRLVPGSWVIRPVPSRTLHDGLLDHPHYTRPEVLMADGARGADKRQSRSDSALATQAIARTNLAEKVGTY